MNLYLFANGAARAEQFKVTEVPSVGLCDDTVSSTWSGASVKKTRKHPLVSTRPQEEISIVPC